MSARTRSFIVGVTTLALTGVACTGNGTETSTSPATPSDMIPTGPVKIVKGEFELEHVGVVVHLSWAGTTGTMTIENGSDLHLDPPSLYAISQGPPAARVDIELPDPPRLAPGESVDLDITFPIPLEEMGMVILSFGVESWGALSPVVEAA